MKNIINALLAAAKSILNPKMLTLVLWPMLLAAGGWLFLAIVFWHAWMADLTGLLQAIVPAKWLANGYAAGASRLLLDLILLILLVLAVHLTALLITAIFAMPLIVRHVAATYYPGLEEKKGGTFAGSLRNTLVAVIVYLILLAISLPLWLIAPLALILPALLTAWLNQRLFRYDALAEHASRGELEKIAGHASARLFILGAVAGLVQFVPVVNLFLPVYMGLAFSHMCLGQLVKVREGAGA
jgi:CysZ protein